MPVVLPSLTDFYYLLPEIVLTVGALILLLADLIVPRDKQSVLAWVALAVLAATGMALLPVADAHVQISHGLISVDRFALFFKVIFLGAAALTVLMSVSFLQVEGTQNQSITIDGGDLSKADSAVAAANGAAKEVVKVRG